MIQGKFFPDKYMYLNPRISQYCQFGVSPVNLSDSDLNTCLVLILPTSVVPRCICCLWIIGVTAWSKNLMRIAGTIDGPRLLENDYYRLNVLCIIIINIHQFHVLMSVLFAQDFFLQLLQQVISSRALERCYRFIHTCMCTSYYSYELF